MSGVVKALEDAVLETPISALTRDEIEIELIKFGSFCSVIYNKKLKRSCIKKTIDC